MGLNGKGVMKIMISQYLQGIYCFIYNLFRLSQNTYHDLYLNHVFICNLDIWLNTLCTTEHPIYQLCVNYKPKKHEYITMVYQLHHLRGMMQTYLADYTLEINGYNVDLATANNPHIYIAQWMDWNL